MGLVSFESFELGMFAEKTASRSDLNRTIRLLFGSMDSTNLVLGLSDFALYINSKNKNKNV